VTRAVNNFEEPLDRGCQTACRTPLMSSRVDTRVSCSLEIELREGVPRVSGPESALAEVRRSNEYSGGWLASASDVDLLRIIRR